MKRFNEDFRTKLYDAIKNIEDNSLVEIVVLIKPQSGSYRDIAAWTGIIFSFLLFTFFMFAPVDFDVFLIYAFTIISYFGIYFLIMAVPELIARAIPKSRKHRNVEIFARALFQKAGIRFTNQKIGTLIYFSLFEKKVFILPDRGAETAVPAEEWTKINNVFQAVFSTTDLPKAILNALAECKSIFSTYIPLVENDINELPDDLNVDL
jgi:putative membrane protein